MECRIGIHLCIRSKGFDGEFTSCCSGSSGVGGMVVGVVATATTATAGGIIVVVAMMMLMLMLMRMVRHGNVDRDDDEKQSTKIAGTGGVRGCGVWRNVWVDIQIIIGNNFFLSLSNRLGVGVVGFDGGERRE